MNDGHCPVFGSVQNLPCVWEDSHCPVFGRATIGRVSNVLCSGGWALPYIWEGGHCPMFWRVDILCDWECKHCPVFCMVGIVLYLVG